MKPVAVFPYLFVDGADAAIAWYTAHLGAIENLRVSSPDGSVVIHARLHLGDSVLMLSDVAREWSAAPPPDTPSAANLVLYVEDVDATQAVCVANGATELMPVGDKFWGERMGKIRDPFGHVWNLATVTEPLSVQEIVERADLAFAVDPGQAAI